MTQAPAQITHEATRAEKHAALLVAVLASFMTPFLGSATNVALPSIAREFALNAVMESWVQTAYMLGAAMFLLPIGRLADILGRKRVFTAGIIGTALVAIATTLAPNGATLVAMRLLHGMTNAMIFGTSAAMVTAVYARGERGAALGMTVASVYVGLTCGPAMGGWLTDTFGWRSIFYAILPMAALIVVTVVWRLHGEWADARGKRFDYAGTAFYALGLSLLVLGGTRLKQDLAGALSLLAIGILSLAAFFYWEARRSTSPLLNVALFRNNRIFVFSNIAAFLDYAALSMIPFYISLYLQHVTGRTALQAGLVLLAQPLIMAILSPITGRLSDRIEPRWLASSGLFIIVLGLLVFITLSASTSILTVYAALVVIGFGMALFSSPNINAIMSSVGQRHQGVASAVMGTMRLTGNLASMSLATLLMSLTLGPRKAHEHPDQFMQALTIAFTVAATLSFLGALASLARGQLHQTEETPPAE